MAGDTFGTDDHLERGESLDIGDDAGSITATKIYTPKGERLELASDRSSSRLDAIEIEALSWQDAEFYLDLLDDEWREPPAVVATDTGALAEPLLRVSNEYSEVIVGRVPTDTGDALSVASEPLHYEIAVRPIAVEAVVERDHSLFSELLNQPYGPMDH
jgi:hypothetical protein